MRGVGEPVRVSDLGDEYRGEGGTDAGQLLDGRVTAVTAQLGSDQSDEPGLVCIENIDELEQRDHALGIGFTERHAGQLRASGHAEQVRHRDQDAGLGEHGVHLRLESGA
ncbi:hypothetical protein HJ581_0040950 [Rhodococcus opacus]|uniref:hypothetical protein n=1 Tax=Rhodococcus opacus TaxID=37919 RepID=UPI002015EF62|nr:hypothetical protein [Rhodococcus opacus]MDV7090751.1 hypothetical protein [Rhodococcus opacus]WKN61445.1 hypothetical protein HJ581_0040950 [Rhodococcus opacus]